MAILLYLFKKSKRTLLLATVFGLLGGASSTFLITTIHRAIEGGLPADRFMTTQFYAMAIIYLLTYLSGQIPLFQLSEGAVYHLRLKMIERILHSPLRFLERMGPHRLYATLTNDIGSITRGLNIIPKVVIYSMIILGCLLYVSYLSPAVLVALAVFTLGMVGIFSLMTKRAKRRFKRSRETGDQLFKLFRDTTEGLKELKMNAGRRSAFLNEHLQPTAASYKEDRIWGLAGFELATTLGNLGFFFVIGAVVFLIPHLIEVDPGLVSGVVLIFVFMISPLSSLLGFMPVIAQASVALNKIEALGLNLDEIAGETYLTGETQAPTVEFIELEGVQHTYYSEREDEQFQLGPIDLKVTAGQIVFIVGGNGSGKSTLAKLIAGLYEPEAGRILLDGRPVDTENRDLYRQCFATVFTDFHLFQSLLGLDSRQMGPLIQRYLERLHLDHKVTLTEGTFSTTNLSTGQRKRLALLVAVAENRPIYLFDEWACDQDPQFKRVFYQEILPDLKAGGKTVIAVTHDDQYFSVADHIIKLADGHLTPYGETVTAP
ncbi:MAG: cyclic peptide export ABC transporter [Acidobacteriota bacterium]|nr:cyclic peptide export ABC transporter [Acidobacteriota bacterium]